MNLNFYFVIKTYDTSATVCWMLIRKVSKYVFELSQLKNMCFQKNDICSLWGVGGWARTANEKFH